MLRTELEKQFSEKDVTWIIDTTLLHGTLTEKLPQIVEDLGYKIITLFGNPNTYDLDQLPGGFIDEGSGPVVAYGCINFILKSHSCPWLPGSYPQPGIETHNLCHLTYMQEFEKDKLLNRDYVVAPIKELIRNKDFFFKIFNTDQLFIKDVNAFKRFGAKVLSYEILEKYLEPHVEDNENNLVMIAEPKCIRSEHRFVIVNKEVVAYSTYNMNGVLDIRIDVPDKALHFAKDMAKVWQPCPCYTLDVAMTGDGSFDDQEPKLLELNSFSCAGLYACDIEAVVKAVSKQSREDYLTLVAH